MNLIVKLIFSIALVIFSGVAAAHPGHDHGHWSSGLIHLLWILPLVFGLAAVIYSKPGRFIKRKSEK